MNYEEAMMSLDSAKWLEAMKSEMGSMYENKVWTLIDLPDDRWVIENKWIFKRKTDADGSVIFYKARLVAKGFRQVQGVDYGETFSLVVMLRVCWNYISDYCIIYEILQIGCQTLFPRRFSWGKVVCDTTGRFCLSWNMLISMQSSSNPSEDWSEHLGVGIYALMRWSKILGLYNVYEKLVFPKKWVGAL